MRLGRLKDLAKLEGMPPVSALRRFIAARPDFPLLEARQAGQPYLLDLDIAPAFVRRFWRAPEAGRAPGGQDAALPPSARLGRLRDLVAMPGMPSAPSLRRFIAARSDFPVIEQGGRNRDYLLDLNAAAAFVAAHWRDGRVERRQARLLAAREEMERAGMLPLFGDDLAPAFPAALAGKQL